MDSGATADTPTNAYNIDYNCHSGNKSRRGHEKIFTIMSPFTTKPPGGSLSCAFAAATLSISYKEGFLLSAVLSCCVHRSNYF
jgi:hypothetical protein